MTAEEDFEYCINRYKDIFTKEEFIRIYNLRETNIQEHVKIREGFTNKQEGAYLHAAVAYGMYLKEKGIINQN